MNEYEPDLSEPTSEILHKMEPRRAWMVLNLLYAADYVKEGAIHQAIQIAEQLPYEEPQ